MTDDSYRVSLSNNLEDPAWDAFVAGTPGGHHVQTSLWAQVKASIGWSFERVVIRQGTEIAGGAQVLMRPLALGRTVGFVSKGPLLVEGDSHLAQLVLESLLDLVRRHHVQSLIVQPAIQSQSLVDAMADHGFRPTSIEVAPTATVIIDLKPPLQQILSGMKRSTRYNIRLSQRRSVAVREGDFDDLATYYRLLLDTARRKQFSVFPEEYYRAMWRIMEPHGYLKLFIAEFEGQVLAAMIAVPFGDTLLNKLSVWSGEQGQVKPNEALQWAAIEWARSHGYRYYDLEGIEPDVARRAVEQQPPDPMDDPLSRFKLGFGGRVTLLPSATFYIANPILRQAAPYVLSRLSGQSLLKRTLSHLRTSARRPRGEIET